MSENNRFQLSSYTRKIGRKSSQHLHEILVTDDWALCEVSKIIVKMLNISRRWIVPVSITLVCFVISQHLNIFTLAEEKSFARNQENKDVDRVKMIEDKCDKYEERLRQDYEMYEEVENELEFTSVSWLV